jgi:hypothetical protein
LRQEACASLANMDHATQLEALHTCVCCRREAISTGAGFATGVSYDDEEGRAPQLALRPSCDFESHDKERVELWGYERCSAVVTEADILYINRNMWSIATEENDAVLTRDLGPLYLIPCIPRS